MTARNTWRLAGTAVLAVATVVPYIAGLWTAWAYLFNRLPTPFGLFAMLGIAIAPIQLVRDILDADRGDRDVKQPEENPENR